MNILKDLENEILNQNLCRIDFRKDKSLFLGIGNRIYSTAENRCVSFYGEWEIGTYNSSWRIIKDNKICLASESDIVKESYKEIVIDKIITLLQIQEITPFDLRFIFSDGLIIDFFNCYCDEDEMIHVLKNDGTWWEKDFCGIWHKGLSSSKKQ